MNLLHLMILPVPGQVILPNNIALRKTWDKVKSKIALSSALYSL